MIPLFCFWIFVYFISPGHSQIAPVLPLPLASTCQINIVSAPSRYKEFHLLKATPETPLHTYTFYQSHRFQHTIPTEILASNKSIIQHGYLRLFQNQKS